MVFKREQVALAAVASKAAEPRAVQLAVLHRDGDGAIRIEHAAGALAGGRHAPLRLGGIAVGPNLDFKWTARGACRSSASRFRRQGGERARRRCVAGFDLRSLCLQR